MSAGPYRPPCTCDFFSFASSSKVTFYSCQFCIVSVSQCSTNTNFNIYQFQSALDSSPRNPSPVIHNGDKGEITVHRPSIHAGFEKQVATQVMNCELMPHHPEDRYLNAMPPAAVLPSPVEGAAEPVNPAPSAAEQDTVSIPEGKNTHTHTHSQRICFMSAVIAFHFACCQMSLTDTCWAPLTVKSRRSPP